MASRGTQVSTFDGGEEIRQGTTGERSVALTRLFWLT